MEIIVEENKIEGLVDLEGWRTPQTAISMHKTFGGYWVVSSSMCLPSGIDEARKVVECVNAAFAAMDNHQPPRDRIGGGIDANLH